MAIHATQLRPCSAYVFAGQTHTLAPSNDDIPAGQGTHALAFLAPGTLEYVPAGHAVQAPPFGPVYPASHTQLLSDPLEAGAREFAGHKLQLGLPSGDHCPDGHARHVSLPTAP